jgi:hypothetical protein
VVEEREGVGGVEKHQEPGGTPHSLCTRDKPWLESFVMEIMSVDPDPISLRVQLEILQFDLYRPI